MILEPLRAFRDGLNLLALYDCHKPTGNKDGRLLLKSGVFGYQIDKDCDL